ncbi:hypothetical protein LTR96_011322 [Exophiala xenobiotica]|nr:hypothetical protein LTR72_011104 [Exophiala xenobiotica]KAK5263255.1 hypothetical protein LTR96_011322 [Exophiala xenobiotica]KAK5284973.1 hypothetical protein LTR14_011340 [Exophiala xenobiotica]KAK5332924.1 hypothetical protein LTR98_010974 [Exophiala xenobiotica]KAK5471429.1 hypothetical protein LTR55_010847 [Exophiala xenobiotica]
MLPPPVPSAAETSSSSSSRKRKRSDVESAAASSTSSASHFSRRTKQKIVEWNGGEQCWHCGGAAPDIAHVIGRRDGSFSKYVAGGLLTFDHLGDEQNGVPLCPSCHRAFDDLNDPGLVFLPTHLEYFIDFEHKDYQSRIQVALRLGHIPPRIVPTPQMYSEYLKRQGISLGETNGGLYWRYTLRDFFPVNADKSFIPGLGPFKEPGIWCGAPMAALRRAFQIVGNPTLEGIPEDQLEQLWQLRQLYARRIASTDLLESATVEPRAEQIESSRNDQIPVTIPTTVPPAHAPSEAICRASGHREHNQMSEASVQPVKAKQVSLNSTILGKTRSVQLSKFGAGASTEVNIQRYIAMMMA